MEPIKKFLNNGTEGLFLLMVAVFIFTGFNTGFQKAESKSDANLISDNEQALVNENKAEKADDNPGDVVVKEVENLEDSIKEEPDKKIDSSSSSQEITKTDKYSDLKIQLKKYCGKNGSDNNEKCRKYCREAKDTSNKNDKYEELREKYCESDEEELSFIVGSKEFKIAIKEGESVFGLMKRAKNKGKLNFKYDDYGGDLGVMITEINGVKNGSDPDWTQNKYWMLYVNGKSSSVGASALKIKKSDTSIEWKYEKF